MADAGIDGERLRRGLGAPALRRVVERIARRIARDPAPPGTFDPEARVTLTDPTPEELEAYGAQTGRNLAQRKNLTLRLGDLDRILRQSGIAPGLYEAVARLRPDLVEAPVQRAAVEQAWQDLFRRVAARLDRPDLHAWLADLRGSGLLRALADDPAHGEALMDQALRLLEPLPPGGTLVKEWAAGVLGDAHALDGTTPLNTLINRFAQGRGDLGEEVSGALRQLTLWRVLGLQPDTLSSTVLLLGLTAAPDAVTGRFLNQHATVGEPYRLSLRLLLESPPAFERPGTVFVCENPAVVQAAAERLGPGHAPLLCTEGQPSLAAALLLESLRASGAVLRYHGDFDWAGIRIANNLMASCGARPWRMATTEYLAATGSLPLDGQPVAATWDPDLTAAMERRGIAIHEEAVLSDLLADLPRSRPAPGIGSQE